jgi:alanine racemase
MPRPIHASVSLAAVRQNLARVRECAPRARVWAVVKANAYGHGIERVFAALSAADGFALLDLDEAQRVRDLGYRGPILLLEGFFGARDLAVVEGLDLTSVIHCDEQLAMLTAHRFATPVDVYLKINCGMNRLGFDASRVAEVHHALAALPGVRGITLMTHFANADLEHGCLEAQAAFERSVQGIAGPRSLSNSAAILAHPPAHADWVRPGIMLYGASPFAHSSAAEQGLRPAMTLSSELIAVRQLRAGEAVGYGSQFVAPAAMRIGVVACGYADGYPRIAGTGTPVAVDGVRTRTVGRVSMDMLTVDLSALPGAAVGSPVELWGAQVPVDEVALAAGTSGYEMLCAVARRVPISGVA